MNKLASRIKEIQLPRATLSAAEKNSFAFGYWTDKHIDNQRKLNLRSAIEKAAGDPEKLKDVRGLLAPVLRDTLHWSGTPRVTIRLSSSKPAANLSVWLVTLPYDSSAIGTLGAVGVQSRGWADPQNYKSLTRGGNYDSKRPGEPLVPGKFYDLTFDLEPADRMIPPGKQLGLMIMSSDRDFTLWPQPGTQLTVDLARTKLVLPVVGGAERVEKVLGR